MSLPSLNRTIVLHRDLQTQTAMAVPRSELFALPEKVLQFGAGGFLRAFADYFIDQANRQGLFNGRIVVVQSTGAGRSNALREQEGLFTLCVQGLEAGAPVEAYSVISSISRTFAANEEWPQVLQFAGNPDLELVLSNTTEVGITLDEGDAITLNPPRSFPGKLTAFLYERYKAFDGAPDKGLIIIPCELVDNNGDLLQRIVLTLAQNWRLGDNFVRWLERANRFCNSLVDRIVPGTPAGEELQKRWQKLGYEDRLLTSAEIFSLWAVEGGENLRQRLAFAAANPSIIVAEDITPYRERKVRILNGAHTLSVPVGFLLGNQIVLDNMRHPLTSRFIERIIFDEIVPSLEVDQASAREFAQQVLERWRNPFLQHKLLSILRQSPSKMRARTVPTSLRDCEKSKKTPPGIAFGFAAYLLAMRSVAKQQGKFYGRRGEEDYLIEDDQAGYFHELWSKVASSHPATVQNFVKTVCADKKLWGVALTDLPGFTEAVSTNLSTLLQEGIEAPLSRIVR